MRHRVLFRRASLTLVAPVLLAPVARSVRAQEAQSAVADSSLFRPLDLPAPNRYRTGAGRPGPDYWQQRVDYRIAATLDPASNTVRGRETIHYVNRSPDALPYLWLFLEQNICAPTSVTSRLNQPPLVFLNSAFDFSCQGFSGGLTLDSARVAGRDAQRTVFGTTMRIDLPRPLAPHDSIDLDFAWHFGVPPQGAGRMGHDGPLYEIAQWYPRMVVYDDVRGWNHEPYIGAGEFYLEYGSFDVHVTVPATYIVAATGQLRNAEQVLTATQRDRLARARRSDTAVAIITRQEAGNAARTRPATSGTLTWHFTADSVRDFAFAAGPNFRWDASGYDGILIETLYRPSADKWEEANRMARGAIKHFSEQWFHYPYSHATTVEGPIEGMEYPMLTFVPNSPTREEQQWVVAHEFGHEWFPMVVGSNERLYPWMDEGFNTFIDLGNAADYFAGTAYGDTVQLGPLHLYSQHAIPGEEQPLITKPVEVRDLFWVGYQKPALMMRTLREEVLGRERFDHAFRDYIRAWAFRHPTPADFFRIMRDDSGMELDWFWRGWIFTTARLDQAVDSITAREGDGGGSVVVLENRGTMVMPAALRLTYADGTADTVRLPVEMWNLGSRFTFRVPGNRTVRRAELDPRHALPDVDRTNNVWPREGQ
ncbi:MAG TPA: M1 family metallopeptidase [Gemmatimonadaceae bacterium]|nr:M1 family metallopeptidase [Gemmatimonadaceae bacterium]